MTLEVFEVEEKFSLWNLYKGVVKVGWETIKHQVFLELEIVCTENLDIRILRDIQGNIKQRGEVYSIVFEN